jgi:hypothetical protein
MDKPEATRAVNGAAMNKATKNFMLIEFEKKLFKIDETFKKDFSVICGRDVEKISKDPLSRSRLAG